MKSLLIVFASLFLLIATPFVFSSIDDALTEDFSQSVAGVTTSAGVYAANITVSQAAYNNSIKSFSSVASNITSDMPTPASYNSTSKVVLISGLEESSIRTITVDYLINNTGLADGQSTFLHLLRWFYIFIIVGMSGGAIYAFFKT